EGQACGVASLALDYCSGPELCGDGYGVLVKALDYTSVSTWGNALDHYPDLQDFIGKLQWLYDDPHERRAIAKRGMERARTRIWSLAVDQVALAIEQVIKQRSNPLSGVALAKIG